MLLRIRSSEGEAEAGSPHTESSRKFGMMVGCPCHPRKKKEELDTKKLINS